MVFVTSEDSNPPEELPSPPEPPPADSTWASDPRATGLYPSSAQEGEQLDTVYSHGTSVKDSPLMEGYVDKQSFDQQWIRYWCVVRDDCLHCYVTPDDHVSADVTELSGYDISQLIDKIQGKRFVLSLQHRDCPRVLLSLDSREELTAWCQALSAHCLGKGQSQSTVATTGTDVTATTAHSGELQNTPRSDSSHQADVMGQEATSAQRVKQKLLAEMLRQKVELEKMQAARGKITPRGGEERMTQSLHLESLQDGGTDANADERICNLTRLRQRRMSTQIKLETVQRQLESAGQPSPRERKSTMFPRGRKRPDVVQSNSQSQPALEEQLQVLSSRLEEIDSRITSHSVSPKDSSPAFAIGEARKSHDHSRSGNALSRSYDSAATSEDPGHWKESSRSHSLKSSMQKLAHRTFSRANWHWKKSSSSNSLTSNPRHSGSDMAAVAEHPPDVIDMTSSSNNHNNNNNNYKANVPSFTDASDIRAPPDSFKSGSNLVRNAPLVDRHKKGSVTPRAPKERVLTKVKASNSFSSLDRLTSKLKTSKSSPSLSKLASIEHTGQDGVDSADGVVKEHVTSSLANGRAGTEEKRLSSSRDSSCGPMSPRRTVKASALAEIQAFEELSFKFLGDSDSTR